MANIIDFLKKRGMIDQMTHPELRDAAQEPLTLYHGVDPTADTLHIGNLVGLVMLRQFQKFGHKPVILLGGATGLIGDPSGKDQERPLLTAETVQHNVAGIQRVIERFLPSDDPACAPVFVNNYHWYAEMNVIEFLRDVGKQFRVGTMMGKESVRKRLTSEEGMSYTEFSYQVLQGYDFYHLLKHHKVSLQIGGSDQYGNITAGGEFVRRMGEKNVYGLTYSLLTRSDGKKFGKSEKGAIWIDEQHLSPYEFYQYFFRTPDADVTKFMRALTLMENEEIDAMEELMKSASYKVNFAQQRLAEEVTKLVHGEEGLQRAMQATAASTPGRLTIDEEALDDVAKNLPNVEIPRADVLGQSYVDIVTRVGLLPSKGEARRLTKNGGAYVNGKKVETVDFTFEDAHFLKDQYIILSAGKKKSILLKLL